MKRYVCVAFVIVLALVYQSQANAGSLDGTEWLVQVFIYDAITGQYLGSYIDHFTFSAGQLATFSGYSGPYGITPGAPGLPWQAMVTPGTNNGSVVTNSTPLSRTYYGVATNGMIWGVFVGSAFRYAENTGSISGALGLIYASFYGVQCECGS